MRKSGGSFATGVCDATLLDAKPHLLTQEAWPCFPPEEPFNEIMPTRHRGLLR